MNNFVCVFIKWLLCEMFTRYLLKKFCRKLVCNNSDNINVWRKFFVRSKVRILNGIIKIAYCMSSNAI